MQPMLVHSSNGELLIDKETGKVIDFTQAEGEAGIADIHTFDIEEWKRRYSNEELPDDIDILDLGYWYGEFAPERGKISTYEPPVEEWRNTYREASTWRQQCATR